MTTERINTYEGLFLFPQSASTNMQAAVDLVKELLARADAEIISFSKWDERRLAYEIKGNKRGIYFLVYFKAPAPKLAGLERDGNLSEQLLRFMITRADLISEEQIKSTDAQEKLADEIKLRAEQIALGEAATGAGTSKVHQREEKPAEAPPAPADSEAAPDAPTKSESAPADETPAPEAEAKADAPDEAVPATDT